MSDARSGIGTIPYLKTNLRLNRYDSRKQAKVQTTGAFVSSNLINSIISYSPTSKYLFINQILI
jgi:hypothetical protein